MPSKPAKQPKTLSGLSRESADQRAQRFVEAYLSNGENITQAALAVGFAKKSAASQGSRLLKSAKVQQLLDSRRKAVLSSIQVDSTRVLQEVGYMATADARELVEYRVDNCRYCWGQDHRYQRTDGEFEHDQADHAARAEEGGKRAPKGPFDPKGGPGFQRTKKPNPACPDCCGEGIGRAVFKDTRTLSPAAVALYAGVKETKDGLEIKTHSKDGALEKLMRHYGLFKDKLEVGADSDFVKAMLNARSRASGR